MIKYTKWSKISHSEFSKPRITLYEKALCKDFLYKYTPKEVTTIMMHVSELLTIYDRQLRYFSLFCHIKQTKSTIRKVPRYKLIMKRLYNLRCLSCSTFFTNCIAVVYLCTLYIYSRPEWSFHQKRPFWCHRFVIVFRIFFHNS